MKKLILQAVCDPGAFTKRGHDLDGIENMQLWQARAVQIVIDRELDAIKNLLVPDVKLLDDLEALIWSDKTGNAIVIVPQELGMGERRVIVLDAGEVGLVEDHIIKFNPLGLGEKFRDALNQACALHPVEPKEIRDVIAEYPPAWKTVIERHEMPASSDNTKGGDIYSSFRILGDEEECDKLTDLVCPLACIPFMIGEDQHGKKAGVVRNQYPADRKVIIRRPKSE